MCGYLAEHFGEPEIYISALSLKYHHQKHFKPKCLINDDGICTQIINFFNKVLQYPKDLSIIHSSCAGIQYISMTELDYSQTLSGSDLMKWQKRLIPFTEYGINTMIDLMGHKWMIQNIYKSCLLTTYYLLKLAIKVNDKASVLKILKFSTNFKGKLNEFHIEVIKELLQWVASVNIGFSTEYEDMVLQCIESLYSLNLDHCNTTSYIFTLFWINKLSCKGLSFFKLLNFDYNIDSDDLHITNEVAYKIITRLNIFRLFILYGPKTYFEPNKVPNAPVFQNLPIDNIIRLSINSIKIAKLNIQKELEPIKSTEEEITDDEVFVTKAKMRFKPVISLSSDMCIKLYRSSIELIIALLKSHIYYYLNIPGNIYKEIIHEIFHCNNVLECQKFLIFFGEVISNFLSFILNTHPLSISIKVIESIFDMYVINQLELLVKTSCTDNNIIFTIGKYSLEIGFIIVKFVSDNLISTILTTIPSTILRAQEAIIRIYLTAIKADDSWQAEFIRSNIDTILSFLSFSISGYIETPKNVGNNLIGLFKLYQDPIYNNDFENRMRHELRIDLTDEEIKMMIVNYQELWIKMIESFTSEAVTISDDSEDKTIANESSIEDRLARCNIENREGVMNHVIVKEDENVAINSINQNLLVDRMKRRLGEINKIKFK